jgi:hypothetical protein
MTYFENNSMHSSPEYVFCSCWMEFLLMSVRSFQSIHHLILKLICLFFWSGCPIYFWEWCIEVTHCCVGVFLCFYSQLLFKKYELECSKCSMQICHFLLMNCSLYPYEVSLSLLTYFSLKSVLSVVSIPIPACCYFVRIPFLPFHFKPLSLPVISSRQKWLGLFSIQSANLCFLIGNLSYWERFSNSHHSVVL